MIGNQGTVVYVISTSSGLVMIDALPADQTETQLLRGFQKLGFDDDLHLSAADWELMEHPPAARGGAKKGPQSPLPKHDQVITEGQPTVLGHFKIMPVAVPGHKPGSMGFIFALKTTERRTWPRCTPAPY